MGMAFLVTTRRILFTVAVMVTLGSQLTAAFPSGGNGGFTSGEVPDEPTCTFRTSQLDNLLRLMKIASRNLRDLRSTIQPNSGRSVPSDRCERYLWNIKKNLAENVRELILIKVHGVNTTTMAEKFKALQHDYARLDTKMKKLISQHGQQLASIRKKYNKQLQTLERRVTQLLRELEVQALLIYDLTVENVVLKLKHEEVEAAVSQMNYFFLNKPTIAGDMLKRVVNQMWASDMRYFSKVMGFIQRLPSHSRLGGYSQQVENMKPLTFRDASSLLKLSFKIKAESTGGQAPLGRSILDQFPATIIKLMRHDSCLIKNEKRGHYMKVVSADNTNYMVGEASSEGGNNRWTLVPFQDSEDSPVHFRIRNTGSGNYIFDEQGDVGLTPLASKSKWEIKFASNRLQWQYIPNEGYLFSPSSSRYLYEAQRSWEPWRCGVNQFLDCAVLTSEDRMYDEGKWLFECS